MDRDEPYKKMMGRLTEEVVTLRKEIRQLKKTSTLFGESSTKLLPNLPLNSMEDLNKFDNELHKNAEMISQLVCLHRKFVNTIVGIVTFKGFQCLGLRFIKEKN